jgi:hypothetical protein
MSIKNNHFQTAAKCWNLTKLYNDLAEIKGKPLTSVEKIHLRGLLCGYSPAEIAAKRQLNNRGVEANLCKTLYQYVKKLVNKSDQQLNNWVQIPKWLEEAGYKMESSNESNSMDGISLDVVVNSLDINIKDVDVNVRKAKINLKRNRVFIDVNIRFVAPIEEEIQEEEETIANELNVNIDENGYFINSTLLTETNE